MLAYVILERPVIALAPDKNEPLFGFNTTTIPLAQKQRTGYDDFSETGSYEFAQMGATVNSEKEAAIGRPPREASRPMSESRAGFTEAHGAGMQILMDAALAVEMGIPIYG